MKILSKFKDYYDFVVDSDYNTIYERHTKKYVDKFHVINFKRRNELSLIAKHIPIDPLLEKKLNWKGYSAPFGFWYRKTKHIPDELGEFISIAFCDKLYPIFKTKTNQYIFTAEDFNDKLNQDNKLYLSDKFINEKFLSVECKNNIILNCPIVLRDLDEMVFNPKLSDYGFQKLFTPTQCYQELYNWFSLHKKEPHIPSSPDDMNRYEAKGFDKKTSFRNIK
jgi:hypothetical protein